VIPVLEAGCAILFAVFLWWASTGAILFLDGLPRRTYVASMAAMSVIAALSLAALWATRGEPSSGAVVIAFTAALALWAWNEMAFLMGFITGPRKRTATPGLRGAARFRESAATLITHEVAIAATALLIWIITRDGQNLFGLWTFLILWVMRLSTKINIFLGAPNITEEFLPPHLSYLASYFRKRPMNGFFPFSVTLATLGAAWLAHLAFVAGRGPGEVLGYSLIAALTALAALEHWLLFVPLPAQRLWAWSLKSHAATALATVAGEGAAATNPSRRQGSGGSSS
jgi:putative photosynthetic complex assembly protein 2